MNEYPQRIEAWKLSNGIILESEEEARTLQKHRNFQEWFDNHEIYVGHRQLQFEDFIEWLEREDNEQNLLKFLHGREVNR